MSYPPKYDALEQSSTTKGRREQWYEMLDLTVFTPLRIIWSEWRGRFGLCIVVSYILMGTVGVMAIDQPAYGELTRGVSVLQLAEAPLGTDPRGQSLFGMIVHATPPMLEMVVAGALFTTVVATAVGLFSGFKGGLLDQALMTVTDIAMTIPGLPLVVIIAAILEPEQAAVVGIVLSINAWAGLARQIRSEILSVRQDSYVEASRVLGLDLLTILRQDLLPNVMPFVLVRFMIASRDIIFGAVGLYYLGLLPFTQHNWGTLLDQAYRSGSVWNPDVAYQFWVPLLTILGFSLGVIWVAQSLDAVFNPRIIAKRSKTIESDEPT